MTINPNHLRVEGCTDGRLTRWFRMTHLPTGIVVENDFTSAATTMRGLMEKLQAKLDIQRGDLVMIDGKQHRVESVSGTAITLIGEEPTHDRS